MPTGTYQRKPRVQRVEISCSVCEKSVRLRPSEAAARTGLFCSRTCASSSKRTFDAGRKCDVCGETISLTARASAMFCSRACQGLARRVEAPKWQDPEFTRAYNREYRQKNYARIIERAGEWAAANPEKRRLIANNYAHRQRVAGHGDSKRLVAKAKSKITSEQLRQVYAKAQHRCVYCGAKASKLTLDHVEPIVAGGAHRRSNLIPCCKSCNSSKGAKDVAGWLHQKHGVYGLARALIFLTRQKIELGLYQGEVS